MLTIQIPYNNVPEREYIIKVLLEDYLGIEYEVKYGSVDYVISGTSGKSLIIRDAFFNKYKKDLTYLKAENIPENVVFTTNPYITEYDVPIIFGTKELIESEDVIVCGIDIFAACFFMLARWEEFVIDANDNHGRFRHESSLAFKHSFLNRPIVDEMVAMLFNMLRKQGLTNTRLEPKYEVVITHDVDDLELFYRFTRFVKRLLGDIYHRKSIVMAWHTLKLFLQVKLNFAKDPFDTFDWLMTESEKYDIKSTFYFMSGGSSNYDNRYSISDKRTKKVMANILARGHKIGIHTSYNSFISQEHVDSEIQQLSNVIGTNIVQSRQHYLRFKVPETWRVLASSGIAEDSSMYYSGMPGFRCGTGHSFTVYDVVLRKVLSIVESPLIFMDSTFINGQQDECLEYINELADRIKKYGGSFVLLWHNCTFYYLRDNTNSKRLYRNVLQEVFS